MGTFSHNRTKSTTGRTCSAWVGHHARRLTASGRSGFTVALLALAILSALGCTSARHRESPTNIVGNLRFRDSDTEARFSRTYRSGSLYSDFRTVMLADAIAMDRDYRAGYVGMLRRTYLLSDTDAASLQREQDREFADTMSVLVFLFGGSNRPIPLGEPTSPWKVLLQDDDGQVLTPMTIEKLRPEGLTYQYLNIYFYGLDRWAQVFKIAFPKINKAVTHLPLGKNPVELIVTGLAGTVRLSWKDARVFYGPEPAPASSISPTK